MSIEFTVWAIHNYKDHDVVSIHGDDWSAKQENENRTDSYIEEYNVDIEDLLKSPIVQQILKEALRL